MNVLGLHIPVLWQTVALLSLSNIFMTFAWYAHLKHLNEKPWWIAALISWGCSKRKRPMLIDLVDRTTRPRS